MTKQQFKKEPMKARTLGEHAANGVEAAYWRGYARGVRRRHYGKRFSTDGEHLALLALAGDENRLRYALGQGYRGGLENALMKAVFPGT